jgi:hypothetical protein
MPLLTSQIFDIGIGLENDTKKPRPVKTKAYQCRAALLGTADHRMLFPLQPSLTLFAQGAYPDN